MYTYMVYLLKQTEYYFLYNTPCFYNPLYDSRTYNTSVQFTPSVSNEDFQFLSPENFPPKLPVQKEVPYSS